MRNVYEPSRILLYAPEARDISSNLEMLPKLSSQHTNGGRRTAHVATCCLGHEQSQINCERPPSIEAWAPRYCVGLPINKYMYSAYCML